ncbi:hypothetical protein [Thermus brockianus]|uniref:hypothetical protein n=1 Tax=Thermus brockianus TaxID=56956 RepID=UPI001FCA81A3|nr:hypothetical protein [Thermus brockianus]
MRALVQKFILLLRNEAQRIDAHEEEFRAFFRDELRAGIARFLFASVLTLVGVLTGNSGLFSFVQALFSINPTLLFGAILFTLVLVYFFLPRRHNFLVFTFFVVLHDARSALFYLAGFFFGATPGLAVLGQTGIAILTFVVFVVVFLIAVLPFIVYWPRSKGKN